MTEKPKLELVDTPTDSVFDDIEAVRKTATIKVTRRVVAVNVAVGKPKNNIFFRCHPDPAMSLDASVLVGPEGSDDFYFVAPVMLKHHAVLPRLRKVTIAIVYSWPGGAISLWPVPSDEEHRIACWKSARTAFERFDQNGDGRITAAEYKSAMAQLGDPYVTETVAQAVINAHDGNGDGELTFDEFWASQNKA